MKETITKIKIVEELHKSIGLSKNECSLFLEEVIAKFQSTLEENKNIKIANFRTFLAVIITSSLVFGFLPILAFFA